MLLSLLTLKKLVMLRQVQTLCWSKAIVQTDGARFVKNLSSVLWHITSHYDFFEPRAALTSNVAQKYPDMNGYSSKKEAKPGFYKKKSTLLLILCLVSWCNIGLTKQDLRNLQLTSKFSSTLQKLTTNSKNYSSLD